MLCGRSHICRSPSGACGMTLRQFRWDEAQTVIGHGPLSGDNSADSGRPGLSMALSGAIVGSIVDSPLDFYACVEGMFGVLDFADGIGDFNKLAGSVTAGDDDVLLCRPIFDGG